MADTKISALPASTTPLAGTEIVPLVQGGTTKNVSVANLTAGRSVSASALSTTAGMVDVRATSGIGVRFIETSSGNTNRIQLGTGSGFGYIDATAGAGSTYLSLQAASVEYAKLETSGNLTLNTGNIIPGTAAKGINFTANTPAAGMTSQLLNWYEEGTWTPTMTSASGTLTVTTSSGTYTRIGRFVQFCCSVTFDTDASVGTSDLTIGGLPFTVASGRPSFGNLTSSNFSLGDYGTGGAHGLVTVSAGATSFVHFVRTVNINSRTGCAWSYAGVYQV